METNINIDKNYILDKIDSASSESLLSEVASYKDKLEKEYKQNKTDENYLKLKRVNNEIKSIKRARSLEDELKEEADIYNIDIKDYSKMGKRQRYINKKDLELAEKIEDKAYKLTSEIYKKALKVEPFITNDLKKLESDDLFLIGIDKNIKSIESIARKLIKKYVENAKKEKKINSRNIGKFVHDANRYTFISKKENYIDNVNKVLNTLSKEGYKVIKFKNKWGNLYYQGINVHLKTPYDSIMEIQFHTLDSYIIKEKLNHPYYEITRNKFIPKFNRDIAKEIQMIYQSLVKKPKKIRKYNYRNVGK